MNVCSLLFRDSHNFPSCENITSDHVLASQNKLYLYPGALGVSIQAQFHPLTGELEIKGCDSLKASFPFHLLAEASLPAGFPALSSQMLSGVFPLVSLLNAHAILSKAWKYECR